MGMHQLVLAFAWSMGFLLAIPAPGQASGQSLRVTRVATGTSGGEFTSR